MFLFLLIQYLVEHFVILCSSCLGGVDGNFFENERDELGEPCVCLYFPFVVGVHALFINLQKSCRIVYFPTCLSIADNIRYGRSVGVSCPTSSRTLITVCKSFLSMF